MHIPTPSLKAPSLTSPSHMDIILLAAGNSTRFQNSLPSGQKRQKKQFVRISGRSLIALCVDNLASCDVINKIMLVLPTAIDDDEMAEIDRLVLRHPNRLFTTIGGNERPDSVKNGLDALEQLTDISDFVAIHDCARPFVTEEILQRLFDALASKPDSGVLPVLEIADTVKKQDDSGITTIDRRQLYRAQTPQCFLRREYRRALAEAKQADNLSALTDDCSLYERTGRDITAVQGDRGLEKITTAHDLAALSYLKIHQEQMMWEYATGTGYDVHKFDPNADTPLIICGIETDHDCGVDAHSDGDVGLHALCDAICGAMADGDIGSHFPPSDDRWKDTSSDHFLRYIIDRVKAASAELVQLDVTIICERPKIGPYRDQMRGRIAEICEIDIRRVSVKATTSEQLGFTGRKEGIAAMASASVRRPALSYTEG